MSCFNSSNIPLSSVSSYEIMRSRSKRHRRRALQASAYANTYYVDPSGVDSNTGTVQQPFKTIQRAIDATQVAYTHTTSPRSKNINVAFGTYTESLLIQCPLQLTGTAPTRYAQPGTCCIKGDIVVNIASAATPMTDTQVGIFNMLVFGSVADTSTVPHTLVMKDARIFTDEWCFRQFQTSPDCRTYLENVMISNDSALAADPLVHIRSGVLEMISCQLTAKGPQSVVQFSGSAKANFLALCTFENSCTGTTLLPIVCISSVYSSLTVIPISNCAFTYTSPTLKSLIPGSNSGLYLNSNNTLLVVLTNCIFTLFGVPTSSPVVDAAVPTVSCSTIYYSNNVSFQPALGNITTNLAKVSMSVVV